MMIEYVIIFWLLVTSLFASAQVGLQKAVVTLTILLFVYCFVISAFIIFAFPTLKQICR